MLFKRGVHIQCPYCGEFALDHRAYTEYDCLSCGKNYNYDEDENVLKLGVKTGDKHEWIDLPESFKYRIPENYIRNRRRRVLPRPAKGHHEGERVWRNNGEFNV